jgi:hypothetical protein
MEFVNAIDAVGQPTLYFLDILLPHPPYTYLPSGRRYRTSVGVVGLVSERWGDDESAVIQGYQRHLLQVGFVDTLLGKLLARLKAVGLYDRSLIVITSDHGASFRPNDFRRPLTKTNFQDIMPVPLFIKAPNQREGVISDRNVETIDILPTIADILGIKLPWPVDGHSTFDLSLPERKQKVVFYNQAKERLVFDRADFEAKDVALERKLTLFGSGEDPDGLFKIGPHNSLVGLHVSEVGVAGEADVVVEFDHLSFYERVNPQAPFVPTEITGSVLTSAGTGAELDLAVAVNGTIRAVTRTDPLEGGFSKWGTLVSEASFRPGKNDIEVFVVSVTQGKPRLVRTKNQSTATYALSTLNRQRGEALISSDGTSMPVIPNALGWLDVAVIENDVVRFAGWAGDIKNSELPKAILLFANGEFLYSGRTKVERPDVVKAYGNAALLWSGFDYGFPLSLFEDIANAEIRLFAVSKNGVASELKYPKGYMWRKKR